MMQHDCPKAVGLSYVHLPPQWVYNLEAICMHVRVCSTPIIQLSCPNCLYMLMARRAVTEAPCFMWGHCAPGHRALRGLGTREAYAHVHNTT